MSASAAWRPKRTQSTSYSRPSGSISKNTRSKLRQEAADLLRVTPRTIRNRIAAGLLPAKTISGSRKVLLLDQRDVLGLLTDAKPEGMQEPE